MFRIKSLIFPSLTLLILSFFVFSAAHSQNFNTGQIRIFNVGGTLDLGWGSNLRVRTLQGLNGVTPYLPSSSDTDRKWVDRNGRPIDEKITYSLGGHLGLRWEGKKGNQWELSGGYMKSQVTYYLENNYPFHWPSVNGNLSFYHGYYNFHRWVGNLERAWQWGGSRRAFIYAKVGVGSAWLSTEDWKRKRNPQDPPGIVETGTVDFVHPNLGTGTGGFFSNVVAPEHIIMFSPEVGFHLLLGDKRNQVFKMGIKLNLGQDPLVTTDYYTLENGIEVGHDYLERKGDYFSFTGTYSVPLATWTKSGGRKLKKGPRNQGSNNPKTRYKRNNIVFLLDLSPSMMQDKKVPALLDELDAIMYILPEKDQVSIVVYSGEVRIVLKPTQLKNREKIARLLERIKPNPKGKDVNKGMKMTYKTARDNYLRNANNRVIYVTEDGSELRRSSRSLIRSHANAPESIFLSVIDFNLDPGDKNGLADLAERGLGNYLKVRPGKDYLYDFLEREFKVR